MRHLNYFSNDLDSGNVHPACPQVSTNNWAKMCVAYTTAYIYRVEGK